MTFNTLPIVVHCGWCHAMKKIDGVWVPLTDADRKPQSGVLVSHGMCNLCSKRWEAEEAKINHEIRANDRPRKK